MQQSSFRNSIITGIVAACLLFTGIPAVIGADGTTTTTSAGGTVIVMSFPQGASVFLNGEYHGIAPIRIDNLSPGKYMVSISKAGAKNDSIPIELFEGSIREIGFNLESASSTVVPDGSGSVAVSSNPGGAPVMLDGTPVGITRMDGYAFTLNDVPAGNHTVTIELAGYPPFISTVTVVKNRVVKVEADFQIPATTLPGTPVPPTNRPEPAPLGPLTVITASGLAGLVAAFRRS